MNLNLTKGYSLIVAADKKRGIGKGDTIPWPKLAKDMKHFMKFTTEAHTSSKPKLPCFFQTEECMKVQDTDSVKSKKNAVVMGRSTWESLPKNFRPLSNRVNVILTRDRAAFEETLTPEELEDANLRVSEDLQEALTELDENAEIREIVVIGGAQIYNLCLESYPDSLKYISYTRVNSVEDCDVFINPVDEEVFKPLHISQTFSSKKTLYDICIYGNTEYL